MDLGVGRRVTAGGRLVLRRKDRVVYPRQANEVAKKIYELWGGFWQSHRRRLSFGWLRRFRFCGGWPAPRRSSGLMVHGVEDTLEDIAHANAMVKFRRIPLDFRDEFCPFVGGFRSGSYG